MFEINHATIWHTAVSNGVFFFFSSLSTRRQPAHKPRPNSQCNFKNINLTNFEKTREKKVTHELFAKKYENEA